MRQNDKPSYSRNIHHSNLSNKAGCTAAFQRHVDMRRVPDLDAKRRVGSFDPHHAALEREMNEHVVIKGHPPKPTRCEECRFTIANAATNTNIFEQTCTRCQDCYDGCMRDLRSQF